MLWYYILKIIAAVLNVIILAIELFHELHK